MSTEVGEDVLLEGYDIRKDLFAVQDLEWAQQVCIVSISVWHRQDTLLFIQQEPVPHDAASSISFSRTIREDRVASGQWRYGTRRTGRGH